MANENSGNNGQRPQRPVPMPGPGQPGSAPHGAAQNGPAPRRPEPGQGWQATPGGGQGAAQQGSPAGQQWVNAQPNAGYAGYGPPSHAPDASGRAGRQGPRTSDSAQDEALRNARHTTLPMRIGLGVAMGLFGLCCALPALAVLVFLSIFRGLEMASEGAWAVDLLDDANRDVFDAGVIAGLTVMGLSSLLALAAYIIRRKELPWARWTPPYLLTMLSVLYFVVGAIAAWAALYGTPWNMVISAFVLTTSTLFPVFVLPVWLVRWAYAGAKYMWSWGSAGPYRAGLFSGVLILPTLPILMLFLGVNAAVSNSTSRQASLEVERGVDLVEVSFASSPARDEGSLADELHDLACSFADDCPDPARTPAARTLGTTLRGTLRGRGATDQSRFGVCVDTLMGRRADDGSTEYERQLRRARRATSSIATAEDIVQETLLRVCARYERTPLSGRIEPYFTRAITNALRDGYRRSARIPETCEYVDEHRPQRGSPDFRYASWEIERALCRLSADHRDILVLRAQGSSNREIARILGASEAAVRQRYSRARQQLRVALDR